MTIYEWFLNTEFLNRMLHLRFFFVEIEMNEVHWKTISFYIILDLFFNLIFGLNTKLTIVNFNIIQIDVFHWKFFIRFSILFTWIVFFSSKIKMSSFYIVDFCLAWIKIGWKFLIPRCEYLKLSKIYEDKHLEN